MTAPETVRLLYKFLDFNFAFEFCKSFSCYYIYVKNTIALVFGGLLILFLTSVSFYQVFVVMMMMKKKKEEDFSTKF